MRTLHYAEVTIIAPTSKVAELQRITLMNRHRVTERSERQVGGAHAYTKLFVQHDVNVYECSRDIMSISRMTATTTARTAVMEAATSTVDAPTYLR